MKRNFIGSTLGLLLVAVIAMKQVALGFCLCTETFQFKDTCGCHAEVPASTCGCPSEGQPTEDPLSSEEPCSDCETTVSLDTGDFLWTPADDLDPEFTTTQEAGLLPVEYNFPRTTGNPVGATSPRGSPPETCSLYLRVQSLRL